MASKRPKPEEIVSKLRQVEVLMGQGMSRLDAFIQANELIALDTEPHRVCRRLQLLSRVEHYDEDNEQVFTRSARACRADGQVVMFDLPDRFWVLSPFMEKAIPAF
ncbi:hypothetical protein [uncultured Ruegeria sp.]|uniref:hypothetical protein n=1 Tax=uncultured Ruegeria sp. TaxID=259304 RepID=UPI002633CFD6|nr:hypothetical protein [uncultured Ruegeria sp.]